MSSIPAFLKADITQQSIGLPSTSDNVFGLSDFILLPSPPARITAQFFIFSPFICDKTTKMQTVLSQGTRSYHNIISQKSQISRENYKNWAKKGILNDLYNIVENKTRFL
jgi:hypothetical protein